MTKNDFNFTTPRCAHLNCYKMAGDIHELIGGMSNKKGNSDRDKCIKYHIQLPLCRECHNLYGSNKKYFTIGCEILEIDSFTTWRAIHEKDEITLEKIKLQCIEFYKKIYGLDLK